MRERTCCFTGHRVLPKDKLNDITQRLDREIDILISQGVTNFISGGALGFDQVAAECVLQKRKQGSDIQLFMALPCKNQDELWTLKQRWSYRRLLAKADKVIYVSDKYFKGCMEKRNRYMVEQSAYCICALLNRRSGTGQTVRMAREYGSAVVNVGKE